MKNPECPKCGGKTSKNWFQSSVHGLIWFSCKVCKTQVNIKNKRVPY